MDDGKLPRCSFCYPIKESHGEIELYDFLKSIIDVECIERKNRSILNGNELDFLILNKNLAIEYNGNYWHSEIGGKKDKNYHLNKTIECEKKGIRLIHIFEDEWIYNQEIVKDRLKHILNKNDCKRLYGRNCTVREISSSEKNDFLNIYHIQGKDTSSIKIGAFYNNELIAVMTFGKLRLALGNRDQNVNTVELMRFCTKYIVVGISSKMLSYYIKKYNSQKIISYADRRWSIGNLYEKLGFKKISTSIPSYWYLKNYLNRVHRFSFRKCILDKKLKIYNKNLTEWENMQLNGYDRIWDCGCLKYELIINKG